MTTIFTAVLGQAKARGHSEVWLDNELTFEAYAVAAGGDPAQERRRMMLRDLEYSHQVSDKLLDLYNDSLNRFK